MTYPIQDALYVGESVFFVGKSSEMANVISGRIVHIMGISSMPQK